MLEAIKIVKAKKHTLRPKSEPGHPQIRSSSDLVNLKWNALSFVPGQIQILNKNSFSGKGPLMRKGPHHTQPKKLNLR
jgi:hypothetical protein